MIIQIFFTIVLALILFSLSMLLRNWLVFKYRGVLLNEIGKKFKEDIENEREWLWRYDKFDEVTYNEMMYKFWKPLSSFYKDKSFYQ